MTKEAKDIHNFLLIQDSRLLVQHYRIEKLQKQPTQVIATSNLFHDSNLSEYVMQSIVEKPTCRVDPVRCKNTAAFLSMHLSTATKYPRSLAFSEPRFNIARVDDKILGFSTMEYGKYVKCLGETYQGGWRYSQEW